MKDTFFIIFLFIIFQCSSKEKIEIIDFDNRPWNFSLESFIKSGHSVFDATTFLDESKVYVIKGKKTKFKIGIDTFIADFDIPFSEEENIKFIHLHNIEPPYIRNKLFIDNSRCATEYVLKDSTGKIWFNSSQKLFVVKRDTTDEICLILF